jgi:transcriptional regulator with GAF, ATPase, and Fis domain
MTKCLTCGKIVPRGHGHKSDQKYCNEKCYQNRYLPERQELLDILNRNNNITITAQLLGRERQALYGYMRKLGIKRKIVWG